MTPPDGRPVGLLTFRPRPGGHADVVTVDTAREHLGAEGTLEDALRRLASQEHWSSLHHLA